MGRIKADASLKCSPEVEKLLLTWKPKFGDDASIRIRNLYGEIIEIKRLQKRDASTAKELERIIAGITPRSKAIKEKEKTLVWMLQQAQSPVSPTLPTPLPEGEIPM